MSDLLLVKAFSTGLTSYIPTLHAGSVFKNRLLAYEVHA